MENAEKTVSKENLVDSPTTNERLELKTRQKYIREHLFNDFYQNNQTKKNQSVEMIYEKCLKKTPIPENRKLVEDLNLKYPLYGLQSDPMSFWQVLSNPQRKFRRTYQLTKADKEYFGEQAWR